MPFLCAMVQVEAMALESDTDVEADETIVSTKPIKKKKSTKSPSTNRGRRNLKSPQVIQIESSSNDTSKTKKVYFLSLDGSSVRPPIDRDLQSGLRQRRTIHAMIYAKEITDQLSIDTIPILQSLQTFLIHIQQQQRQTGTMTIIHQCATSISKDYPSSLVLATIKLLQQDLSITTTVIIIVVF
jgi:hypothetical protein